MAARRDVITSLMTVSMVVSNELPIAVHIDCDLTSSASNTPPACCFSESKIPLVFGVDDLARHLRPFELRDCDFIRSALAERVLRRADVRFGAPVDFDKFHRGALLDGVRFDGRLRLLNEEFVFERDGIDGFNLRKLQVLALLNSGFVVAQRVIRAFGANVC